jgi:hypothetical protein
MQKFGFRIKTRTGALVDNLVIQAADQTQAEQKLLQMYHQAVVIDVRYLDDQPSREGADLESAMSLILGEQAPPKL